MLSVEQDVVLAPNSPWTTMPPLRLGKIPAGLGAADLFVTIRDDDRALLRVDLYADASYETFGFRDAVVWYDRVLVGFGHRVYVIDPKRQSASQIYLGPFSGYFGHLYASKDYLLVASGDSLLRLAPDGAILWKTPNLGLDGVVVNSVEKGVIQGQGEWDPPGGWKPFVLRFDSGELISGGDIE
jgi:hypothetical protein